MATIVKIRKATWTQKNGTRGFQYDVYYESGKKVRYNWQKCLPVTAVMFLMDNETTCVTEYKGHAGLDLPVKWETWTRA